MFHRLHSGAYISACPVCDARVFEDLGTLGHVHYLRCVDCGADVMSDERMVPVAFADLLPVYTPMRIASSRETMRRI